MFIEHSSIKASKQASMYPLPQLICLKKKAYYNTPIIQTG